MSTLPTPPDHVIGSIDTAPVRTHGEIACGNERVQWFEDETGQILFLRPNRPAPVCFGELPDHNNAEIQLQIINQLLAHYRPYALPDGNHYYAASAGVTVDGQLFIDTCNQVHIVDQFAGRGCSETGMLRKTQTALDKEDVTFKAVYLMSGIADRLPDNYLEEREKGHIGCLCGECRQNLRRHMAEDAKFIMVPTNTGSVKLSLSKETPQAGQQTKEHMVAWEINPATMYPLPEYVQMDKIIRWDEGAKAILKAGYTAITTPSTDEIPLETRLGDDLTDAIERGVTLSKHTLQELLKRVSFVTQSHPSLEQNPSMENINRAILHLMKEAHAVHREQADDKHNIEITVVMLKTNDGKFYSSTQVDGKLWLPSKPPAIPVAETNALNQKGIVEVYMMTFNDKQIREELSADTPHQLKMPDPAGLNRLIKNLLPGDKPVITVIPINDGTLSQEALDIFSFRRYIRDAFGPDYINPKRTNGDKAKALH